MKHLIAKKLGSADELTAFIDTIYEKLCYISETRIEMLLSSLLFLPHEQRNR